MKTDNVIALPNRDKIDEEAAIWVMRLVEDSVSDKDQRDFSEWIAQSPQHRSAFEELWVFWTGLECLEQFNDYAESDVALEAMHSEQKEDRRRIPGPFVKWSLVASLAAVVGFVTLQVLTGQGHQFEATYQTAVGEQEVIELPDGSSIVLNTNSQVEISYDRAYRHITLVKGEAYFDVAANPKKRFSVVTERGKVTATGTAFSVRLNKQELGVVVTEGSVFVEPASLSGNSLRTPQQGQSRQGLVRTQRSIEVLAGQSAIVKQGVGVASVEDERALERVRDWQDGELSFRGETLEQVVGEIGRYTNVRIEFGDDELRKQRIVAYYKIGDIDRIFEALNVMADIEVERVGEDHVRLNREVRPE